MLKKLPRGAALAAAGSAFLLLIGCSGLGGGSGTGGSGSSDAQANVGRPASGTLELREFQLAYLGSGTSGNGSLNFHGTEYPIKIGGLGVGGIGLAEIEAQGEVYDLSRIEDFPGTYGEVRTGWALGQVGSGKMWLQNEHGVVLHLHAQREGIMLSMGADAIIMEMGN